MQWLMVRVVLCLIAFLPCGCTNDHHALFPQAMGEQTRTIYVVSHDWHAGIVVRQSDIHQPDWPKLVEFAQVDYLEIGWGDKDYYKSSDPGLFLGVRALLVPTESVLHIVGLGNPSQALHPNSEIISIELSSAGFEQMIQRISMSFSRDWKGSVFSLGPGLYGFSQFYASREKYHLFMTCNAWTAEVLQAAGCPVSSTLTVDGLIFQLRRLDGVGCR